MFLLGRGDVDYIGNHFGNIDLPDKQEKKKIVCRYNYLILFTL